MKQTLFIVSILFCLTGTELQAQNWNEWFRQKRTQRRYLTKQILLLHQYLGYLKEGYEVADKGLTLIHTITGGEFTLHNDFFASLRNVNPHISDLSQLGAILNLQTNIIQNIRNVDEFCRNNEYFTPDEVRYVAAVNSNMIEMLADSEAELLTIIHANETEMKDDERLERISKLYSDMLEKHAFVKAFGNDVHMVAQERERQKRDVDLMRRQTDLM